MTLYAGDCKTCSAHLYQDSLVYTCASCKITHYARLPNQKDFEVSGHSESGRLGSLLRHSDFFCVVRNCRGDVFLRIVLHGERVKWYFQPPKCERIHLCTHTEDHLETFYGPFLSFLSNDDHELLFRGYRFQKLNDGSVFVYFSDTSYNTLENKSEKSKSAFLTSQSDTQRPNIYSPSTKNEVGGRRSERRSEYKLKDPSNKVSYQDVRNPEKHLDALLVGEQRPKPPHEPSKFLAENQVTSDNEKRHHVIPNVSKSNRICKNLTADHKEDRDPSAFVDPMKKGQNQDDPSPNFKMNVANIPSTPDLSKVECLRLNPESCLDSLDKQNDFYTNSKINVLPTPSTLDVSEVELLRLNPDSFKVSCDKVTSYDVTEESMFPRTAGTRLEAQGGQTYYTDKIARDVCRKSRNNTLVMEYRTKPQGSDKPQILDSAMAKPKEVMSGQFSNHKKVFSMIQNALCDWYLGMTNWKEGFPFFYKSHETPTDVVFDFIVQQDGNTYPNCENIFSEMNSGSKKKMLILGSPRFGKTTLCSMIAHSWASGDPGISELCVHCSLPEVIDYAPDLSEAIVFYCNNILGGNVSDLESVRDALRTYSGGILLLLDGYDQLPENRKEDVCIFLSCKGVFSESTIAVTSRPTVGETFIGMFDRVVFINGFSKYSLRKAIESLDSPEESFHTPEESFTWFMNIIEENKLAYFSELSPLFTLFAAKFIHDNMYNMDVLHSLYSLLDNVIMSMISRKMHETFEMENYIQLFQVFGRKCLEYLISGQRDFDEKFLKETFGKFFSVLLDCNIFYELSGKDKIQKYQTSGKALQVFFATWYLRKLWLESTNRKQFLEETFCGVNCFGEFIANLEESYILVYVGLIPEIVLKCPNEKSPHKSPFEMYYDVNSTDHSYALDSVNLLLRASNECLSSYRFLRCREYDEGLMDRFGEVLNMIPTEFFSVQHFFYTNCYEKTDFMKIVLREEREPEAVLYEVVRVKGGAKIDRIYLDFAFAKLENLFLFISAQLARYLNQFSLYPNLKYRPLEDYIFELVVQLLECSNLRTATVSCKDRMDLASFPGENPSVFKIVFLFDENLSKVYFTYEGARDLTFSSNSEVFEKSVFSKSRSDIKATIRNCKGLLHNPRIYIDILYK